MIRLYNAQVTLFTLSRVVVALNWLPCWMLYRSQCLSCLVLAGTNARVSFLHPFSSSQVVFTFLCSIWWEDRSGLIFPCAGHSHSDRWSILGWSEAMFMRTVKGHPQWEGSTRSSYCASSLLRSCFSGCRGSVAWHSKKRLRRLLPEERFKKWRPFSSPQLLSKRASRVTPSRISFLSRRSRLHHIQLGEWHLVWTRRIIA